MNRKMIHQMWTVLKVMFARLRFVGVFVVAALVVGYWDDIKNHVDKWTRPAVTPEMVGAESSDVEYYCAMHPYVVRDAPGNCLICGMPLIKRKKGEKAELPEGVAARVQLSPQRIALAGIGTSAAEYRKLSREVRAVGMLDYNETRVAQISCAGGGTGGRTVSGVYGAGGEAGRGGVFAVQPGGVYGTAGVSAGASG